MNRCLSERRFLALYTRDATVSEQSHLRWCADCAERYEAFVEDMETVLHVLDGPPVAAPHHRWLPWREQWVPAAATGVALIALAFGASWLRQPAPVQVALSTSADRAFAADLSAALFSTTEANTLPQLAADTPYLEAALDAGQPCTQNQFLTAECNDQLSPFLVEDE